MSNPTSGRKDFWVVGCLAVAHAALGLALLPGWMFSKYPDAARLLAAGKLGAEAGSDFSPFYLLLNVLLGPTPLRWLQSLLGAACVVAVAAIGWTLLGRLAGLVGAALYAFALPVLLYEGTLEPDAWVMSLSAIGIALLVIPGVRRWPAAGAGAALGLAIAARPSVLPFVALAAGWALLNERQRLGPKIWLKPLTMAGTAVLVALLPPLAIKGVVGQQLGATMSAGAVLHHGNRPEGTGLGAQPPVLIKLLELQLRSRTNPDPVHALYRRFARASEGEGAATPEQTERFWMQKVAAFATHEPAALVALLYRKLCFFTFGPDGHDVGEVRVAAARLNSLPLIHTAWLGLLGTVALALLLMTRKRVGLLAGYVATTTALALLFYVVSRYRLATVPVWCVLCGGLAGLAQESLRIPRRLVVGAAVLGAGVLFAYVCRPVRDAARVLERGGVASELAAGLDGQRTSGALEEATRTFIRMDAAQPYVLLTRDLRGIGFEGVAGRAAQEAEATFGADRPADAFFLGLLKARAGACAEALPLLKSASEAKFHSAIFDLSLDPFLTAAECELRLGDREAAVRSIRRSLEASPGTLDGLALAVAGGATEKMDELFALHDVLSARFALAKAQLAFGNAAQALVEADAVLGHLPEAGVVHYERARALAMSGRAAKAVEAYGRALALFPAHAFAGEPLEAALRARLAESPDDPNLVALAAEHALRAGKIAEAIGFSDRAAGLWGSAAPSSHHDRQLLLRRVK